MRDLPGTPPIVIEARAVVGAAKRASVLDATVGVLSTLAVWAVLYALQANEFALFWGGVIGGGLVYPGLRAWSATRHPGLADAVSVLAAWDAQREAWAADVLRESVEGAAGDARAWSQANEGLSAMSDSARAQRRTQRTTL